MHCRNSPVFEVRQEWDGVNNGIWYIVQGLFFYCTCIWCEERLTDDKTFHLEQFPGKLTASASQTPSTIEFWKFEIIICISFAMLVNFIIVCCVKFETARKDLNEPKLLMHLRQESRAVSQYSVTLVQWFQGAWNHLKNRHYVSTCHPFNSIPVTMATGINS